MLEVSNGDNLYQGCRPHRKDCAMEIELDANKGNDEDIGTYIVKIKKSVFNTYAEHSWRLLFDFEWENWNDSELT